MFFRISLSRICSVLLTTMVVFSVLIGSALIVTPVHAAGITVNTTADELNSNGNCSLREAIQAANTDSPVDACTGGSGADSITVPAGTYTLTILGTGDDVNATGDLDITDSLTINGAGAGTTTIQAGATPGSGIDRVIDVIGLITVSISDVTIANGKCISVCSGGGIRSNATLTVTNTTLSDNTADFGGGIYTISGPLTVVNSTFSDNNATSGGGIRHDFGSVSVTNSTFSGNSATTSGGGIFSFDFLVVANSTFSDNSAASGGAIYSQGSLNLQNTILANSTGSVDCYNNAGSIGTNMNNLIETNGAGANACGAPAVAADPNLGLITGSPAYFPLNAGSPAIDAGDDSICAADPVNHTSQNGVTRPQGSHCDIGSYELPLDFADVPFSYWAFSYIERLYSAGITGGCSVAPLNYCPDSTVTRAQMAIFLLKGMHTSSFTPPAVGGSTGFGDVSTSYWAAAWVKQLAAEGITSGCGGGNFCPDATVTRAQMAVFLLKAKNGSLYSPPAVGGSTGFADVSTSYWAAAFIKQLVADTITSGCGGGNYCPDNEVTRAQMAVFLVKTFSLP